MTKTRTECGNVCFRVKEHVNGQPFLTIEPEYKKIAAFENALITVELNKGTSLQQAESIKDFMNEHICGIGFTLFEEHPLYTWNDAQIAPEVSGQAKTS